MTRSADTLRGFARDLFTAAGLAVDNARAVAKYPVEADRLGHPSHGLAPAPCVLLIICDVAMSRDRAP